MNKLIGKRDLVLWVLVLILILGLALQSVSLWKTKKELKDFQSAHAEMFAGHYPPAARTLPGLVYTGSHAAMPQDWDPFLEMERMQQHINSLFRHSLNNLMRGPSAGFPQLPQFEPDADIQETENEYVIKMDLPGMEKDKINVEVKDNLLSVSGERKTEKEQQDKGYYRSELSYGSFSRTIPLPGDVDSEKVTAEYSNGVLTVKLAKLNPGKTSQPGAKVAVS